MTTQSFCSLGAFRASLFALVKSRLKDMNQKSYLSNLNYIDIFCRVDLMFICKIVSTYVGDWCLYVCKYTHYAPSVQRKKTHFFTEG